MNHTENCSSLQKIVYLFIFTLLCTSTLAYTSQQSTLPHIEAPITKSGSLPLPENGWLYFLCFFSNDITVAYKDTYTGQERNLTVRNGVPQLPAATDTQQSPSLNFYEQDKAMSVVLLHNFGLTWKEWFRSFFRQPHYYSPLIEIAPIKQQGSEDTMPCLRLGIPNPTLVQPGMYREGFKVPTAVEYQQTATDTTVRVDCGRFVIYVFLADQSKLDIAMTQLSVRLSSDPIYATIIKCPLPLPPYAKPSQPHIATLPTDRAVAQAESTQ